MHILLTGKDNSITDTVAYMLDSKQEYAITKYILPDRLENFRLSIERTSRFAAHIANLTGFSISPRELISAILSELPSVPLLVLYSYRKEFLIKPLLEAGATGYLQVGMSEETLFEAIKNTSAGKQYIGIEESL